MKKKRVNAIYIYRPCFLDLLDPCYGVISGELKEGDKVKTYNKQGCPRFGTMGQCYIKTLEGKFLGMVSLNSLSEC